MAKVLVLGGDGFCGWPTALYLSESGYEVTIVDNFSRRGIDERYGTRSLTPIAEMKERLEAWKRIRFTELDVARDYQEFLQLLRTERPTAIVHFAEQRSAPFSMKSSKTKRYTVNNNVNARSEEHT